jgi:hypothetical protein
MCKYEKLAETCPEVLQELSPVQLALGDTAIFLDSLYKIILNIQTMVLAPQV